MNGCTVKTEVINNVIVAMSYYIAEKEILNILHQTMQNELIKVNMEEITTLPAEARNEVMERNKYLIQLFMIKKRNLKRGTIEGYLGAVKRLMTEISTKTLDQMDETDIEWYLSVYEKHIGVNSDKIEASTYNNERRFLSAFYTWMRKAKIIRENPVESTEPKKVITKPIDYYTAEELIKLRDACKNERERAIFEVFRSTGARIGEINSITLDQIDLDSGDIWIQGEKGGKYRALYLDNEAKHYFQAYLKTRSDTSPYMFPQSKKPYGKMSTCGLRNTIKEIGKRAGVTSRVYPHKMRKTLGMMLKNKGVDIGTIQEIMGHASPAVTSKYYAQSKPETLRNIRERI